MAHYKSYREKTKSPKALAECIECGRTSEKRLMSALMIRRDGWASPNILCHVCKECVPAVFDKLGVPQNG